MGGDRASSRRYRYVNIAPVPLSRDGTPGKRDRKELYPEVARTMGSSTEYTDGPLESCDQRVAKQSSISLP
jgi:hypothetical protein